MASSIFDPATAQAPQPSSIPVSTLQASAQPRQVSDFEKLPPELKLIVFKNLPKSDLGNIRLVCNLFNEVATPTVRATAITNEPPNPNTKPVSLVSHVPGLQISSEEAHGQ